MLKTHHLPLAAPLLAPELPDWPQPGLVVAVELAPPPDWVLVPGFPPAPSEQLFGAAPLFEGEDWKGN